MPQATSAAARDRAKVVDDRAHQIEGDWPATGPSIGPTTSAAAGSATDKELPNRNTRIVRAR